MSATNVVYTSVSHARERFAAPQAHFPQRLGHLPPGGARVRDGAGSVDGALLHEVSQALERNQNMEWRIRRYGKACLTAREYEAMVWEMNAIAPMNAPVDYKKVEEWRTKAVQKSVAQRMRVSQPAVNQTLKRATEAMKYFEAHGIEAKWRVYRGHWLLDAPCEDVTVTIKMSHLIKANTRAMMKLA